MANDHNTPPEQHLARHAALDAVNATADSLDPPDAVSPRLPPRADGLASGDIISLQDP
jgi:hypothetical protein